MFIFGLIRGLNDLTISRRLHIVIGFMALWIMLCVRVMMVTPDLLTKIFSVFCLVSAVVCILMTVSVISSLKNGIDAILDGANNIKETNSGARVDIGKKHEILILATTFSELAQLLQQNISEVKSLRVSLKKERQRAEHYERAKQYFLVNMSHEIRTPMNAILGFARYLQDSLKDSEEIESVKMIVESGEHLLATLNDILDFVNIETGEVSFVCLPFNLRDTVHSIFMLKHSNAKIKHIGLNYNIDKDIPEAIYGDAVRLAQILLSLTSNAIKFTESGGVLISARAVSDHDDHIIIEFSVRDTGMGIDINLQEKIFNPFEQGVNHMKRKFGGTGIGLSIVKHLIALQDGTIQLKSKPGEGSDFYFRLPFLKSHAGKCLNEFGDLQQNRAGESEDGKGIRVLIVEDNTINQLLVIKLLQKRGYQTSVAENGKIALQKYKDSDFDIILMDLQMPEMDGYETTIHIRSINSYKKDIPIVAMTAHTIKGEREKCLNIGMNDYISKPFHSNELYEKIKALVSDSAVPVPGQ